ncbi:MAG: hypothetical protein CVU02_02235 [Bacteroidetes bacterium HGW-Bacteroidetes-19]|nr:MAG: hypothetical protein CVU04_02620 [Bacteroidetes bacterium HGW-Bacteroidetes-20]PKP28020.1 MAG: hypothetical protein CVU02_02235 [Bacteroidetes bacterium HGW-Bacteroidetes-19]
MQNLKGKFISFKYRDRKEIFSGYLIDFNDDWTLIKYNPVDYVVDGYLLLKSDKILKYKRDDEEIFKEKVLTAKNIIPTDHDIFPITDLADTLQLISERFGAFKIENKDDTACFIGRFVKMTKDHLYIQEIDPHAKWGKTEKYKLQSIRTIEFDSDYINSLIIYNKSS